MPAARSRVRVWNGSIASTSGGLHRKDLMRVKKGDGHRLVSKKRHNMAMKESSALKRWRKAIRLAKARLGLKKDEFIAVRKGTKLYALAKQYFKARH